MTKSVGDGANRQFMGALSNMFGPSDKERQAKERAREKLKRDLAEQVARKKLERQRLAYEQKGVKRKSYVKMQQKVWIYGVDRCHLEKKFHN